MKDIILCVLALVFVFSVSMYLESEKFQYEALAAVSAVCALYTYKAKKNERV